MREGKERLSISARIRYALLYLLGDFLIDLLFYRSWIAFVLLLPGLYWFFQDRAQALAERRRKRLEQGFLMGMRYVSSGLAAGYSVENAFAQALEELRKIYRPDEPVLQEFSRIVAGLAINQTMEELLRTLAKRSGVEDIQIFAEVFAAARRTGGDLIAIIQNTVSSISRKEETRQEIEVCLASKKSEQNILSAVPCLIICYVKVTSPGFLDPMYGNLQGVVIMSICLGVYVFAFLLGRRIVKIEV